MELDALKQTWAAYDRKLDTSIRLNRRLLRAVNINRVRWPLRRFTLGVGLGALIGLIGPAILGQFIYLHRAEPRFALPAAALDIWVIAMVVASIRQMAMALRIDYDKAIAAIQKQIESLRVLRVRIVQWAVLTGQVVWWIPLLIVALKGFWNVDAYKVPGVNFLAVNLAFGLAIIPLSVWVSRRFGDRIGRVPMVRELMSGLAGYSLQSAADRLAAIAEFEKETLES
jgi:hypothetical protein